MPDVPDHFAQALVQTLLRNARSAPIGFGRVERSELQGTIVEQVAVQCRANPILPAAFSAELRRHWGSPEGLAAAMNLFGRGTPALLALGIPLIAACEEIDRLREQIAQLEDRLLDAKIGPNPTPVKNLLQSTCGQTDDGR